MIITGPTPVWSVKRVDYSDTTYLKLGFQDQECPPNLAFETVHSENLDGQSRQQGAPSHREPNEKSTRNEWITTTRGPLSLSPSSCGDHEPSILGVSSSCSSAWASSTVLRYDLRHHSSRNARFDQPSPTQAQPAFHLLVTTKTTHAMLHVCRDADVVAHIQPLGRAAESLLLSHSLNPTFSPFGLSTYTL